MFRKYPHLYGQYVMLDDNHKSVCIWSEELESFYRMKYFPTLITKEEYDLKIESGKGMVYDNTPKFDHIKVYKTNAALGYGCYAYLILVDVDTYLCVDTKNTSDYIIGNTIKLESFYIEDCDVKIENTPLYNSFLFNYFLTNYKK